jgi:F420 biosynthesis protein FbiB-like protein
MIRRYTDQPVPAEAIATVLAAAIRAPSPHNRQPWRFAVLTGPARHRLAMAMGERLQHDLTLDGISSGAIERDIARSYQRITGAPACILACLSMRDMDAYPDPHRSEIERWMAVQAVAAACQNILLCVTELGLGACWMCAPLFCPDAVSATLDLPDDWQPQALITLGHPADGGKERERRSVDEITLWIGG